LLRKLRGLLLYRIWRAKQWWKKELEGSDNLDRWAMALFGTILMLAALTLTVVGVVIIASGWDGILAVTMFAVLAGAVTAVKKGLDRLA